MRFRLCTVAFVLLQAACSSLSVPAENNATLLTSGTVRIVQIDGKKVCALGGLMTGPLGCPESAELTPGPHTVEVVSYLNQTSASKLIEVDARPLTTYTVSASILGYSVNFRVEETAAN